MEKPVRKIVNICLTDVQAHVIKHRKPLSVTRAIDKSLRNGRPGRFYTNNITVTPIGPATLRFSMPLTEDMRKLKEKYEKEGKEVRFVLPPDGLNLYASKDLIEFIEAQKKKRVDRKEI